MLGVELAGALVILAAYWANATGRWSREALPYRWCNLLGSFALGTIAVLVHRWGFVALEVAWAGITVASLWQRPQIEELSPPTKEHVMAEDRARLLELLKTQALSFGHFILASGKESTFYLDGRQVTLSAEGAYLTGRLMYERLKALDVQAVGGLSMGADPVATAVSIVSHLEGHPIPAFLVRKEAKGHGKGKQVEGPLPEGARVAIVEDTVTTGESALKAIAPVEALGCSVAIVISLVDRLDGARERLEAAGYRYECLFTIRDLGING